MVAHTDLDLILKQNASDPSKYDLAKIEEMQDDCLDGAMLALLLVLDKAQLSIS